MHRLLTGIFLAGLVVTLGVMYFIPEVHIANDEIHYNILANNILSGKGFCFEEGKPTSIRPPLYPAFIACVYFFSGADNYRAVWLAQIFLHLLTGYIVYRIAILFAHLKVGLLASGLYIFYPSLVGYNFLLMSEILFNFLFTLSLYAFFLFLRKDHYSYLAISGIMLALSALTRTIAQPVAVVLALFLLFDGIFKGEYRKGIISGVLLLACFFATLAPWSLRNTRIQHSFTLIDTMGGMNLMMGNYAYTPENRAWDAVSLTGEKSWSHALAVTGKSNLSENEKQKWASHQAVLFMSSHPMLTLKRSLIKLLDLWGQERVIVASLMKGQWGVAPAAFTAIIAGLIFFSYTVIFTLSSLGWFFAYERIKTFIIPTLLVFFAVSITHTVVFGHSRYHLPLIPFMTILTAFALNNWKSLRESLDKYKRPATVSFVWLLIAVFGWLRAIFFADYGKVLNIFRL